MRGLLNDHSLTAILNQLTAYVKTLLSHNIVKENMSSLKVGWKPFLVLAS